MPPAPEAAVEPVAVRDVGGSGHQSPPSLAWPGGMNWAPPSPSSGSPPRPGAARARSARAASSPWESSRSGWSRWGCLRLRRDRLGRRGLGDGRLLLLGLAVLAHQVAEVVHAVAERVLDIGADAVVVERVDQRPGLGQRRDAPRRRRPARRSPVRESSWFSSARALAGGIGSPSSASPQPATGRHTAAAARRAGIRALVVTGRSKAGRPIATAGLPLGSRRRRRRSGTRCGAR